MFPFVDQLSSVQPITNVPTVVQNLTVRARLTKPVLENLSYPMGQLQGYKNTQGRLHPTPPLPELTNFDQVSNNKKWLCTSPPQELLPDGGTICTC